MCCYRCVKCGSPIVAAMVLVCFVVGFLGLIAAYGLMISRHPYLIKRWISTASIFVTHLQTLAIIMNMRLSWPQSATSTMAVMSLSPFAIESAR